MSSGEVRLSRWVLSWGYWNSPPGFVPWDCPFKRKTANLWWNLPLIGCLKNDSPVKAPDDTCMSSDWTWLPSDHQKRKELVAQSCLILCNPMNCSFPSMEFSRQNTGVDCHSLLQEIFPTQGSNPGLLHFRQVLYHWPDKWTKMSVWVHKSDRSTASSFLLRWHAGDSRWKERRRGAMAVPEC